jgi:DNA-binding transcriptional ArsR family regulator
LRTRAAVFAALGDETRLALISRLARRVPQSISRLTTGSNLSRQAMTKHLRVLERAGLVRSARAGRESLFVLETKAIEGIRRHLEKVSRQWDNALARLKSFVEE